MHLPVVVHVPLIARVHVTLHVQEQPRAALLVAPLVAPLVVVADAEKVVAVVARAVALEDVIVVVLAIATTDAIKPALNSVFIIKGSNKPVSHIEQDFN